MNVTLNLPGVRPRWATLAQGRSWANSERKAAVTVDLKCIEEGWSKACPTLGFLVTNNSGTTQGDRYRAGPRLARSPGARSAVSSITGGQPCSWSRAQVSQCPCGRPGARRRLGPGTRFTHSWPRRWARLASLSARAIRYCVTGGWQSSTTCWPSTCGRLAGPSRAGNGAEGKIDRGGHRAGGRRCQNDAAARPNRLYGCVWFREAQGVCACWASASSAFRRWPPSSKGRITPNRKKSCDPELKLL